MKNCNFAWIFKHIAISSEILPMKSWSGNCHGKLSIMGSIVTYHLGISSHLCKRFGLLKPPILKHGKDCLGSCKGITISK